MANGRIGFAQATANKNIHSDRQVYVFPQCHSLPLPLLLVRLLVLLLSLVEE